MNMNLKLRCKGIQKQSLNAIKKPKTKQISSSYVHHKSGENNRFLFGSLLATFLKNKIMNPRILRTVLTWAAPFIIGYVVKKFEERQARKKQQKQIAPNN